MWRQAVSCRLAQQQNRQRATTTSTHQGLEAAGPAAHPEVERLGRHKGHAVGLREAVADEPEQLRLRPPSFCGEEIPQPERQRPPQASANAQQQRRREFSPARGGHRSRAQPWDGTWLEIE